MELVCCSSCGDLSRKATTVILSELDKHKTLRLCAYPVLLFPCSPFSGVWEYICSDRIDYGTFWCQAIIITCGAGILSEYFFIGKTLESDNTHILQ